MSATLRAAVVALVVATASAAGAQQAPAARFARAAASVDAEGSTVAARDSALRYLHRARVQRRAGASMVVAGLGAAAAAYVQYARAGRMGMSGAQVATFAAGAMVGGVGAQRLVASRESMATSRRLGAER
jgi:hypothetical protein